MSEKELNRMFLRLKVIEAILELEIDRYD